MDYALETKRIKQSGRDDVRRDVVRVISCACHFVCVSVCPYSTRKTIQTINILQSVDITVRGRRNDPEVTSLKVKVMGVIELC